jgi:ATP-dependent helicase/nuclease subunit A
VYTLSTEKEKESTIVEMDANRIASWIAERVASNERTPGDFLILMHRKKHIGAYANALSARNIPAVTTGALLPQERELRELLIVLQALGDPENAVAVAAALEGLFFGHSPADLFQARQQGLRFSITHPPANDVTAPVSASIRQLHEWWEISQRHAADVLIEHILNETGLLFHAASQPLGEARAGALVHLVEVLRGTPGATGGIAAAMERIEVLLRTEITGTPLRPGRTDAVRVMNLHKAKGLEADVVILAAPLDQKVYDASIHVTRESTGRAQGGLCISTTVENTNLILAHPPAWETMLETEREFANAEDARLLYVAVTRARHELLVVRHETHLASGIRADTSPWSKLAPSLAELGTTLELVDRAAPGQKRLERSTRDIQSAVADAHQRVVTATTPSFRRETVTESVKEVRFQYRTYDLPMAAGAAWGRVIHRAIEAMGNGRRGVVLDRFIRAVVRDEGLTPDHVERVHTLLQAVEQSPAWSQLTAGGAPLFELPVMHVTSDGTMSDSTGTHILEGVIDAVGISVATDTNAATWHIVDWKTDIVDDTQWDTRATQYQEQVDTYRMILETLTGQSVTGSIERVVQ